MTSSQPQSLISAKALKVKISLSLMPRCFAADDVRELNKGSTSVGKLKQGNESSR